MAKTKISEYSATSADNTDIGNINIAEGCSPANVNNAIRTVMAQLKNQQTGASGDNFTVGGNLSVTGTSTLTGDVTAPTQTSSDNSTKIATTAFVTTKLSALGTMSTQNATAVAITGGTITGITDLTVADGGTGASSITANSVVLGNGTSALSGNLVAPSTSGNVLTSNGTTWTSATPILGLGVGQAWQNLTGSRSVGTSYQNTTGNPIAISLYGDGGGSRRYFQLSSNNSSWVPMAVLQEVVDGNVFSIVPVNFYYRVESGSEVAFWAELR
jgi:hypothetical protein